MVELNEKTLQQLEEDKEISKAMDDRKQEIESKMKQIIYELNKLTTQYIELEAERKEYEEEY